MPSYELALILKSLQKPELAQVIKRCCTYILDGGGFIRGMENLGQKPLPYKMKCQGKRLSEGSYILIRIDGATSLSEHLKESFKNDLDVIKKTLLLEEKFVPPCTVGACEFGELKNPDHEKRLWWGRVHRRLARAERRKKELKA